MRSSEIRFALLHSELCVTGLGDEDEVEFDAMLCWTTIQELKKDGFRYWWLCPSCGQRHEVSNDEEITAALKPEFTHLTPFDIEP